MAASVNYVETLREIVLSSQYKPVLSLVKGFRNGLVYGCKVRFPHSLVMTFLFKQGSYSEKLKFILEATYNHSKNLALMVTGYKSLMGLLTWLGHGHREYHSLVIGCIMGYVVFGEYNKVNEQINLYLLSRIIQGLARFAVKEGYIKNVPQTPFRWFAATVWAVVMWLFTYHRETLQPSLQSSMTYLYEDSSQWDSLRNFIWHNK